MEKGEWPTHCPGNRRFTDRYHGGTNQDKYKAKYRADKAGTRLAGDFVAYIVKVKADLMAFGNTFKLPVGHFSSTYPCWMCKCNKETQKRRKNKDAKQQRYILLSIRLPIYAVGLSNGSRLRPLKNAKRCAHAPSRTTIKQGDAAQVSN